MKKDIIIKWMARFFVISWIMAETLILVRTGQLLAAVGIIVGVYMLILVEKSSK